MAFIVVDQEKAKEFAKENGKRADMDELVDDRQLMIKIQQSMKELAKVNDFASIEMPRKVMLLKDPFTVQDGLLTPTMKLKRNIAVEQFKDQID